MQAVVLNFDATNVAPNQPPVARPAGWYDVRIVGSELKPTSKNDGAYLELTLEIISGEFAGGKFFERLNLQNQNPTAVEIAYRTLSSICRSVGVMRVHQSTELHGIPFKVRVKVRAAGKGADGKDYEASNEIAEYANAQGIGPDGKPIRMDAAAAGPSLPAAAGAPPWANPAGAAPAPAPAAAAPPWAGVPAPAPAAAPAAPAPAPAPVPAAPAPWAPPGSAPAPAPAAQPWAPPAAAPAAPAAAPAAAGGQTPPWAR